MGGSLRKEESPCHPFVDLPMKQKRVLHAGTGHGEGQQVATTNERNGGLGVARKLPRTKLPASRLKILKKGYDNQRGTKIG